MTVMTLNIHHKGHRGHHVPKFLKTVCFGVFSKLFCMQMEIPHHPGEQYLSTTVRLGVLFCHISEVDPPDRLFLISMSANDRLLIPHDL